MGLSQAVMPTQNDRKVLNTKKGCRIGDRFCAPVENNAYMLGQHIIMMREASKNGISPEFGRPVL
jgi:hypothetical protein